jgi:hypothetical protein
MSTTAATYNSLLTRLRCLGERAAAMLLTRWKTLRRITLCAWRIGAITKAALVLTQFEHREKTSFTPFCGNITGFAVYSRYGRPPDHGLNYPKLTESKMCNECLPIRRPAFGIPEASGRSSRQNR